MSTAAMAAPTFHPSIHQYLKALRAFNCKSRVTPNRGVVAVTWTSCSSPALAAASSSWALPRANLSARASNPGKCPGGMP
jgi:hypothetical protein